MSLFRLSLVCLFTITLSVISPARADSTNMLEIQADAGIALSTVQPIDLSHEGAIEFWYRHQSERSAQKTFTDNTPGTKDATSVVLTIGAGAKMACAIVVGPGALDGRASIGVINDLSVLGDPVKLRKSVTWLSKVDEAGKSDSVEFVKGSTYHIFLEKRGGSNETRVFVNGFLQGKVPGTFGATAGLPIVLGFDTAAAKGSLKSADDATPTDPVVFPFDGFIGGLRLWGSGDFEENDVLRLAQFGRLIDPADLTSIPEYGDLRAVGDFTGRRWNAQRMSHVTGGEPQLKYSDPLAGSWYADGATVTQSRKDSSVFDDYAVYTFASATTGALPANAADRAYHVFEDGNYIGTLKPDGQADGRELWSFKHADFPTALPVEHIVVGRERMLSFDLGGMPGGRKFAGADKGSVRLKRRNVLDMGIKSPSAGRLTPQEAKAEAQTGDAMTLVFLYTAYPRFFDRLYGSYNIAKMDPWNLFESAVETEDKVLRVPDADQMFKLNKSEQLIMPFDLEIMQKNLSLDNSTTRFVSNAVEYNSAVTSRIGAGVSGSVTVGTGPMLPVQVSGTVNLNLVVQSETVKEMAGQTTASSEKLLRNKWEKKYALLHRKEVTRVSDKWADALRVLYAQAVPATPDVRRRLAFAFYDKWGTHYPLAAVFGSLELTETTVSDQMRMATAGANTSFEVSVNDGKSGTTKVTHDGTTETVRDSSTIVRAFGTELLPVPIALDLRPLTDLMTPQQFPGEPEIYVDLRSMLGACLNDYRTNCVMNTVTGLSGAAATNAKGVVQSMRAATTAAASKPAKPLKFDTLAVRFKGISVNTPFVPSAPDRKIPMPMEMKFDGQVEFWPGAFRTAKTVELPGGPDGALTAEAWAFTTGNSRFPIFSRTKKTEQVRTLKIGDEAGIQPFGDPRAREMLIKVPNSAVRDYLFVSVISSFTLVDGANGITGSGFSPTNSAMVEMELARTENAMVKTDGPKGVKVPKPFDSVITQSAMVPGSILWANNRPIQVHVAKQFGYEATGVQTTVGDKSFAKDRTDSRGDKFVFQAPSGINGWRKGSAPTEFNFTDKGVEVIRTYINVHYEYALLGDFQNVIESNRDVLPGNNWGTPGVKIADVNPMANRSTTVLRLPPALEPAAK